MTTAINTHAEFVIIIASPLQQWLGERASKLRCTYISCFVSFARARVCVCVCVCGGEDSEKTVIQIRDCHKQTVKNCVQRY
jgi:hypothetical protein